MTDSPFESDLILIDAIRADDKGAFRLLYERYWKPLFIRACKSVDEDVSKDLIQEVMVSLWKRRHDIQVVEEGDIGKYLFTALKYRIISFYTYTSAQIKNASLLDSPVVNTTPENLLEGKELENVIDATIESMPDRMQLIFRMSREHHISIADIARQLNLSEQTVKNQITQALKRLKTSLLEHQTGSEWIVSVLMLLCFFHD